MSSSSDVVRESRAAAKALVLRERLLDAQFGLKQADREAVLLLTTGLPLAGRTQAIGHLVQWLNPKLLSVHALPSAEGDWQPPCFRFGTCVPRRGELAVIYDGWYDDYLVADRAGGLDSRRRRRALDSIRAFERLLAATGVRLVKLHFSGPRSLLRERLKHDVESERHWRVTEADVRFLKHFRRENGRVEALKEATDVDTARWQVIDASDSHAALMTTAKRLLRDLEAASQRRPVARTVRPAPARARPEIASRPGRVAQARAETLDGGELQGELALQVRHRRFASRSVAIVLEGLDGAGKSTSIRRLTEALDPRQYVVVPVGPPSAEERAYPYLHRFWSRLPRPGQVTFYDRSWYGRVLVERVEGLCPRTDWRRAYEQIRHFETDLVSRGVIVLKFWLAVSRAEQLVRFHERAANPAKRYKLDSSDWRSRRHWWEYQAAADEAIEATDRPTAPWIVVPADDKHYLRHALLDAVCQRLRQEFGLP